MAEDGQNTEEEASSSSRAYYKGKYLQLQYAVSIPEKISICLISRRVG